MWSCPDKPIPRYQIEAEYRRLVQVGMSDIADTGWMSNDLLTAIQWFEERKRPNRGYRLLREGIDQSDPRKVSEGYGLIESYWAKEDAVRLERERSLARHHMQNTVGRRAL